MCALFLLSSCVGHRAMVGYYENHPEMRGKLVKVRAIYIEDIQGAENEDEAGKMRQCIVDEIWRKGKGRFKLVKSPEQADAIMKSDMEEELGPVDEEEPLPFELKPKFEVGEETFLRMKLVDPKSGMVIYKTTTEEMAEFDIESMEEAAHTVIRNLMMEIELAEGK